MLQEINLYKFLPKKTGFDLTQKTVLLSYGIFILLILALNFISLWQRHSLNAQLDELNNTVSLHQLQLTTLVQKYPVSDLANLTKTIQQLREEYENKARIIDLLSPYANFSAYLGGLGNAIVTGVWLTQITFDRGENKIALKGYALHPTLLAQFYNQLENQPIFSNLIFKLNEINQTRFPASFYITAKKANAV